MNTLLVRGKFYSGTTGMICLDERGGVFYSEDGKEFYKLCPLGCQGSAKGRIQFLDNPVSGKVSRLTRTDTGVLEMDGQRFLATSHGVREIVVLPPPCARKVEYLFRGANGLIIVVSRDRYGYNAHRFRLGFNTGEGTRQIPITKVTNRPGIAVLIETTEGVLFIPGYGDDTPPTWQGEQLERSDNALLVGVPDLEENALS